MHTHIHQHTQTKCRMRNGTSSVAVFGFPIPVGRPGSTFPPFGSTVRSKGKALSSLAWALWLSCVARFEGNVRWFGYWWCKIDSRVTPAEREKNWLQILSGVWDVMKEIHFNGTVSHAGGFIGHRLGEDLLYGGMLLVMSFFCSIKEKGYTLFGF